MSKLFDWLAIICAFLSIWLAILYNFIEFEIFNEYHSMISFVPVIAILSLGVSTQFMLYFLRDIILHIYIHYRFIL